MKHPFTIFPAIDLKDGRCVRLRQGRADDQTVYAEDPVRMAKRWEQEGARYLHVVDLDGAFQGRPAHLNVIEQIAKQVAIPLQVGGGIRTDEDIRRLLEAGIDRVILGTRLFSDPEGLKEALQRFGAKVALGIDAKDGRVQINGWTKTTETTALSLAKQAEELAIQTVIYTNTARDGMMRGVDLQGVAKLCDRVSISIIASGGVSTFEDIQRLRALRRPNLVGAIVGKALYEGKVQLAELVKEGQTGPQES